MSAQELPRRATAHLAISPVAGLAAIAAMVFAMTWCRVIDETLSPSEGFMSRYE